MEPSERGLSGAVGESGLRELVAVGANGREMEKAIAWRETETVIFFPSFFLFLFSFSISQIYFLF
jgi:hypothetical protein